ncbi:hypothetical protein [Lactococcus lactis]|uniref:hypothetical protein n=1 Tax=Lactococcus lactis TaxID=1358 RepID=UPI00072A2307|nr:hypothetical protein [Lactococcus lactis]KST97909.1 hypothetical protein KF146_0428 [Lactococcus lactis subsp. lactis]MDU0397694.1 hypothetical protein [Lactococcus lactis]
MTFYFVDFYVEGNKKPIQISFKKYHPDIATEANSDAIMKKINWAWDEIKKEQENY